MTRMALTRDFYTIGEATKRLSERLGEEVTATHLFQFASREQLRLSLLLVQHYAIEVAPVSYFLRKATMASELEFGLSRDGDELNVRAESLERQQPISVEYLNGVYRLWNYYWKDENRALIAALGTDSTFTSATEWHDPIGLCVLSSDGIPYQLVENRIDPKRTFSVYGWGDSKWQPASHFLPRTNVVVRPSALAELENLLCGSNTNEIATSEEALRGTERQHYLKVIAGLMTMLKISPHESTESLKVRLETTGRQASIDRATLTRTRNATAKYRK